jgi:hypothetical protein
MPIAQAIGYALYNGHRRVRYAGDGPVKTDTNRPERAIRPLGLPG